MLEQYVLNNARTELRVGKQNIQSLVRREQQFSALNETDGHRKVTHDNELRLYKATLFQNFLALKCPFSQYCLKLPNLLENKLEGKKIPVTVVTLMSHQYRETP